MSCADVMITLPVTLPVTSPVTSPVISMITYPSGILRTSGAPKVYFCHSGIVALDQVTVCTNFFLEEVILVAVLCLPRGLVSTRVGLVSTRVG